MWILGVLLVIVFIYIMYTIYFKSYVMARKTFKLLIKTLDVRDLLVVKLLPEIRRQDIARKVAYLINERVKCKESGHLEQMNIDIKLNKELKVLYEEVNKNLNNEVVKATFKSIIELEKKLKSIRKSYNDVVDKYNTNLVTHKKFCIKILKMKPLDTYGLKCN